MKDPPGRSSRSVRPINLTQVLKLAGCVQSGGEAKMVIAEGLVRVNGQVELRKRRQMKAGDTVAIGGRPDHRTARQARRSATRRRSDGRPE